MQHIDEQTAAMRTLHGKFAPTVAHALVYPSNMHVTFKVCELILGNYKTLVTSLVVCSSVKCF